MHISKFSFTLRSPVIKSKLNEIAIMFYVNSKLAAGILVFIISLQNIYMYGMHEGRLEISPTVVYKETKI